MLPAWTRPVTSSSEKRRPSIQVINCVRTQTKMREGNTHFVGIRLPYGTGRIWEGDTHFVGTRLPYAIQAYVRDYVAG